MKKLLLIVFPILLCSCTTIQIPLLGTNIMRPRAGLADLGGRAAFGVAYLPNVEGTIEAVEDSQGNTINQLPGETDMEGGEVGKTSKQRMFDCAMDWSRRYSLGFSSTRAVYFMWDYALWDNLALTLTPSYGQISHHFLQ